MDAEVIVVDFRRNAKSLCTIGPLVPQLIAMALNSCCEAEVAIVITDYGEADDVTSNYDLAKKLSRVTERPVVYVDDPQTIEPRSMRQLGMPASLISALMERSSPR